MCMSYLFAALAIHSVVTNGVSVRWFEERVPMSDGVALYTYGVLPSEGMRCALILERSPYVRRRTIDGAAYALSQQSELKRGYAYVRQHVRGSGMSEGELVPGTNDERRDGLDTLAWLRTLPHYGGEVYLAGASYLATVHWSYLSVAPDDVKGAWLIPVPEEFWAHPRPDDDWWRTAELAGARQRRALLDSKISVMMVTGFYDIYTGGIFDMWRELPLSRRANCALVVDDGEHGGRRKDIDSALDWFDWCRGKGALKLVRPGETVWLEDGTETWHHAADMTDGSGREAFDLAFSL